MTSPLFNFKYELFYFKYEKRICYLREDVVYKTFKIKPKKELWNLQFNIFTTFTMTHLVDAFKRFALNSKYILTHLMESNP